MQSTRNLCGFFAHLPRYPFPISEKNSSVVFTAARMSTFQLSRKGERPQFDNGGKMDFAAPNFSQQVKSCRKWQSAFLLSSTTGKSQRFWRSSTGGIKSHENVASLLFFWSAPLAHAFPHIRVFFYGSLHLVQCPTC